MFLTGILKTYNPEHSMKIITSSQIPVAVIGCGFGRNHIKILANGAGSFVLKTICDTNKERISQVLQLPECQGKDICVTTDCQTVFNDPEIQVVVLSLPHHLHKKFAIEAAKAGKHILIDKPLARNVEEGKAIIRACETADVQLMIAFNFRYDPMYQVMHEAVTSGKIGPVTLAVTRHYQMFYCPPGSNTNWRSAESVGGGAIMGSGVHNIDMLRHFFGDVAEVYAAGVFDENRLEAEAGAAVVFRCRNNTVVNFFCNWCVSSDFGVPEAASTFGEWEFYGRDGELRRHLDGKIKISRLDGTVEVLEVPSGSALQYLWMHFENALRTGSAPLTCGKDALETQKLIETVYQSMASHQVVTVDQNAD